MTKLRQLLHDKNITVSQLSIMTEIPFPTLSKYVDGSIPNPPVERINTLLTALDCKFEDIY